LEAELIILSEPSRRKILADGILSSMGNLALPVPRPRSRIFALHRDVSSRCFCHKIKHLLISGNCSELVDVVGLGMTVLA
jgi:hypothetical protein